MTLDTYADISSHNGVPDLAAHWNAGHRFLMVKATEGTGYAWSGMPAIVRQWHQMGGRAGYYHWLYGTFSGRAQHDWFWGFVQQVFQPGDELMTDFEDVEVSRWVSDAQHLAVVKEFDALCDGHAFTTDYAPNWYLANMPLCVAYFKTRLVVASDYSHNPPLNPHGFTLAGHQFTDRAVVTGFAAPVDYNRRLISPPIQTIGDSMSAAEVAEIKAYIDGKFQALQATLGPLAQNVIDARSRTGDNANALQAVQNTLVPLAQNIKDIRSSAVDNRRDVAAVAASAASAAQSAANASVALNDPTNGVVVSLGRLQQAISGLPTTSSGPLDLAAVTQAARAGAAAGANLDGKTLTIHDQGAST